jgi:polar amino acid transport system substrate-binding protein
MKILKLSVIGLFALFFATSVLAAKPIVICTDANFWYPFTYVNHEQNAAGLHIDIISAALKKLGFQPLYRPNTWQSCLAQAKAGTVDAIATASYLDDRAVFLNYPEGAANDQESPWRVMQVNYVVITSLFNEKGQPNTQSFNGSLHDIPHPIRVTAHYSVIQDFEKAGLPVKTGESSLSNFKRLLKDHNGAVVDVEAVASYFLKQPEFSHKLMIQKKPLNNKSYYLAFSKRSPIKLGEEKIIWQEIANVRDDPTLMAEFLKKY